MLCWAVEPVGDPPPLPLSLPALPFSGRIQLQCCVPFTPVGGPRLLVGPRADSDSEQQKQQEAVRDALARALVALADGLEVPVNEPLKLKSMARLSATRRSKSRRWSSPS